MTDQTEPYRIRLLGPDDTSAACTAIAALRSYWSRHSLPRVPVMDNFLSRPENLLFVAWRHIEPVGYVLAYRLSQVDGDAPMLYVHDVHVSDDYRREGVGSQLLEYVRAHARETGCRELFLLTNRSNVAAQALYISLGLTRHENSVMFEYQFESWPTG